MSKFSLKPKELPLQKKLITRKEFNYSKGICNLNFTLQIDTKKELCDFKECLFEAIKDIDKILKEKN